MTTVAEPFQIAERYIELRKKWGAQSWVETLLRFNETVVTPILTLFMVFIRKSDLFGFLSAGSMVVKAWIEYLEYCDLRFKLQDMVLKTMMGGGPFIVTNDPDYMPYVWADGAMRVQPGSGLLRRR